MEAVVGVHENMACEYFILGGLAWSWTGLVLTNSASDDS